MHQLAAMAHLATGFTQRQPELINQASLADSMLHVPRNMQHA
jgi:hypothetical protein